MAKQAIGIVNGPNLNLTGTREPSIYGHETFEEFIEKMKDEFSVEIRLYQSNHEGELIDALHEMDQGVEAIVLNAGGYTHTSVALADAIRAIQVPVIEVHLSNIFAREDYRHISLIGAHCKGIIAGFGMDSYRLAMIELLRKEG